MAALIVFTRYPRAGQTKTRLIPLLGPGGAADLQRRMTLHTLRQAQQVGDVRLEVRYTGGSTEEIVACFGGGTPYVAQGEGDLGQRMYRAANEAFAGGHDRAVLIGSDCPGITPALLRDAFKALDHNDLVVGPANDGGYYLIGLRGTRQGVHAALFKDIPWGTAGVLRATLDAAGNIKLRTRMLRRLADVDVPKDLHVWRTHNSTIGVVVPTLNEEAHIEPTLRRLQAGDDVEVLIADGGSTDRTVEIARSCGAGVIACPRGRALQMNAAVGACDAGLLLFCHADTLLPKGYDRLVRQTLADPGVAVGAFGFRLDASNPSFRRIERGVAWRCRYFKLPYGDQGLFIRRTTFERLRGFAPVRVMEDFDLVRRARKFGHVVTLGQPAVTSARRWRNEGIWKTTWKHQAAILKYFGG